MRIAACGPLSFLALTSFTDKYRSAAKRAAWYDGEDEPGAYNSFRKFRPRRFNALDEINPAEFGMAQPSAGTYNLPRSSTPPPETASGDESPILEVLEPDSPVGEKVAEKKESTGHLRITDHMGVLEKRDKDVKFTIKPQIRATILNSWFNILFVLVPVGFIVNYLHLNPIAVFVVNFVAIVPSSTMLSYALEELMLRVGDTVGGLLSITFRCVACRLFEIAFSRVIAMPYSSYRLSYCSRRVNFECFRHLY